MKSQIQYLKEGVLIPSEWFKEFGPDISVQKCCNVIIIEPRHRVYARNKLKEMVEELRKSGEALPLLSWSTLKKKKIVPEFHDKRLN